MIVVNEPPRRSYVTGQREREGRWELYVEGIASVVWLGVLSIKVIFRWRDLNCLL